MKAPLFILSVIESHNGVTWSFEAIGKGQIRFVITATNIDNSTWFGVGISNSNNVSQGYQAFKGSTTQESFVKTVHKNHSEVTVDEHSSSGFSIDSYSVNGTTVVANFTTDNLQSLGTTLYVLFLGIGNVNENGTYELSTTDPIASSAITLVTREFANDIEKPPPKPCTITVGSKKGLNLDNRRCGVRNADDQTKAQTSEICYSAQGDGVVKEVIILTFEHQIRVMNINFTQAFGDFRKSLFRGRKRRIELEMSEHFLDRNETTNPFVDWDFEKVFVFEFRAAPNKVGFIASAFVQFGPRAMGKKLTDYKEAWNQWGLKSLGKFILDNNTEVISDAKRCPALASLQKSVPTTIWSASGLNGTRRIQIGQTVDFVCPLERKFSFDNDSFFENDDKYTVLCTTLQQYTAMEEPAWWPKCVKSCWMRLPTPPEYSGLEPIIPDNTIPVGQYGQYKCKNESLGVERGATIHYRVKCLTSQRYWTPGENNWPVCHHRTTTVSPAIRMAFDIQSERRINELNDKNKAYQWREGDEHYVKPLREDHFTQMTLPAALGLLVIVFCCCFCTHRNSPCCSICEDKTKRKKYMVPLKPERPLTA
eukprot:TCALIF_10183-PA protein Name:"Protein of unknown function" AED:0.03 eAED:0.03 QI:77/0.69/0.85/0.92/0.46/0.64/14/49/592